MPRGRVDFVLRSEPMRLYCNWHNTRCSTFFVDDVVLLTRKIFLRFKGKEKKESAKSRRPAVAITAKICYVERVSTMVYVKRGSCSF